MSAWKLRYWWQKKRRMESCKDYYAVIREFPEVAQAYATLRLAEANLEDALDRAVAREGLHTAELISL